ncbi:MAG TPA: PaaX family transcriptional regulator C-terminal domain-containing protein [Acidimicrobiales bacterium]|jgi:phenylacetic acid degradation operon negative regulatory protein
MTQDSKRPFTARSVLASGLLGMDPPELPVAQLIRLTSLFGLSENRARVALSRMVATGEVTTDGAGCYRLAGRLAERQARQSASRSGRTLTYRGDWHLVMVTTSGSSAEVRTTRRRALAYARLSELREGVWMRPANIDLHLHDGVGADLEVMTARPEDALELVDRLWDLAAWSARATELLDQMRALRPEQPGDLAPGFELSAAVLRHLQADPLLPDPLLPAAWPGAALRRDYDTWDARYRTTLRTWSRAD